MRPAARAMQFFFATLREETYYGNCDNVLQLIQYIYLLIVYDN